MSVRTYDPSQVSLSFGVSLLTGWDNIRISRAEDSVMFSAGTSGELTRSINQNKLGSLTLTYPQSALDNEILSGYEITKVALPATVVDRGGTTVALMKFGTVVKPPDSDFGKEATQREWVITGELSYWFVGSNNKET